MAFAQQNTNPTGAWEQKATQPMDTYEFNQWAELLFKRSGIYLPEKRKTFLLTNLNIRMRELGMETYREYFDYVLGGRRGAVEWEILIDKLTVHETRFFRDEQALEMIRTRFVPEYLASNETLRLNTWSVGCATGEEPYSLAMLLDFTLRQQSRNFYLSITGTDISGASLASAREAIYHNNRLTNLPEIYRRVYCKTVDKHHSQVVESLRKRVCFSRLNLLDIEKAKLGLMDIIMCQNVLIYFQREQRLEFLNSLAKRLQPGGILLLGAGEITDWNHPDMELMSEPGILVFRREGYTRSTK